jgi:hypothetical protein
MAEFTAQVMYNFTGESETELSIRQNKEIFKYVYKYKVFRIVSIRYQFCQGAESSAAELKSG